MPTVAVPTSEQIAELVQSATHTLFDTMMSAEVTNLDPFRTGMVEDREESVFCMIGFSGDFIGSGSLHCGSACAIRLASALMMTEYESVNEEVLDAMAEITNMIVGNFKTTLEEQLGVIGISTPTVIFGQNYTARNFGSSAWTVVPFAFGQQHFEVRISLQANKKP